jgi:hypothetical protein
MMKLIKILLLLSTLLASMFVYSTPVSPKDIEAQNKHNINALFSLFKKLTENPKLLNEESFSSYFANRFTYEINGKEIADNYHDLKKHWEKLLTEYKSIKVTTPVRIINATETHLLVDYKLTKINKNKTSTVNQISALIHFKSGRIKSWRAIISNVNANSK